MSAHPELPPVTCPRTDAVLALYLDGDLGLPAGANADDTGYEFVCPETLALHLRECGTCQDTLRRARRLDATLAESAGRRAARWLEPRGQIDRGAAPADDALGLSLLLERAAERARAGQEVADLEWDEPRLAAAEPRVLGPSRRRASTAAVLLAAVCAVVWIASLMRSSAADAEAGSPMAEVPVANAPAPVIEHPELQHDALPPVAVAFEGPFAAAPDAALRARRAAPPAAAAPPPLATLTDTQGSAALRLLAGQHLLRALQGTAPSRELAARVCEAFAGALAHDTDGTHEVVTPLATQLFAAARETGEFVDFVRRAVNEVAAGRAGREPGPAAIAALVVAAGLGGADLDALTIRAVRRCPDLAPMLAAALRSAPRPDGGAALRLDTWQALVVRGEQADDLDAARLWFAGAPAATWGELRAELAGARTPHRLRCLLAMACCDDGSVVQPLLDQLGAARQDAALAAAFALAHLPHRDLLPLVPTAQRDRDAWLLRAALAHAGLLPDPQGARPQLTVQGEPAPRSLARFTALAYRLRDSLPAAGG